MADGPQVAIDGDRTTDDWAPQTSKVRRVTFDGAPHRITLAHYPPHGFVGLRFEVQRK
jgi:hypothetical protein